MLNIDEYSPSWLHTRLYICVPMHLLFKKDPDIHIYNRRDE